MFFWLINNTLSFMGVFFQRKFSRTRVDQIPQTFQLFNNFLTLRVCRLLKSCLVEGLCNIEFITVHGLNEGHIAPFLVEEKDLFILHSQYHSCWCPGDKSRQGISSYDIDLVIPEHCFFSSFSTNLYTVTTITGRGRRQVSRSRRWLATGRVWIVGFIRHRHGGLWRVVRSHRGVIGCAGARRWRDKGIHFGLDNFLAGWKNEISIKTSFQCFCNIKILT